MKRMINFAEVLTEYIHKESKGRHGAHTVWFLFSHAASLCLAAALLGHPDLQDWKFSPCGTVELELLPDKSWRLVGETSLVGSNDHLESVGVSSETPAWGYTGERQGLWKEIFAACKEEGGRENEPRKRARKG